MSVLEQLGFHLSPKSTATPPAEALLQPCLATCLQTAQEVSWPTSWSPALQCDITGMWPATMDVQRTHMHIAPPRPVWQNTCEPMPCVAWGTPHLLADSYSQNAMWSVADSCGGNKVTCNLSPQPHATKRRHKQLKDNCIKTGATSQKLGDCETNGSLTNQALKHLPHANGRTQCKSALNEEEREDQASSCHVLIQAHADISQQSSLLQELGEPLGIVEDAELCSNIVNRLEKGNRVERHQIMDWLRRNVKALSLARHGCRVVQKVLEVACNTDRDVLAAELQVHFKELYESQHGNHVVSKMVEVMPATSSAVEHIVQMVQGQIAAVARHRFGCRILERLIEHVPERQLFDVIEEIILEAEPLCRHPYGNFVVQHLLEYASPAFQARILEQMLPNLPALAMHRIASHVVQRALDYCDETEQLNVVNALFIEESAGSFHALACSRYGSFVVEQLEGMNVREKDVRKRIGEGLATMSTSQHGKRVLEHFGFVPMDLEASDPAVVHELKAGSASEEGASEGSASE